MRPTKYSEKMASTICEMIGDGKSLKSICLEESMPSKSSVYKWLLEQPKFSDMYRLSREIQCETLMDEIMDIADDSSNDTTKDRDGNDRTDSEAIQRSKLRVDARFKFASQVAPQKYGTQHVKQDVTLTTHEDALNNLK